MKKKKSSPLQCCEDCINLIAIGEGDHICTEFSQPVVVLSGYVPTEDYYKCNGACYEEEQEENI